METLNFKKGEKIFSKGDVADKMFRIAKGKVRIMADDDANAIELALLKDGAYFGEMGIIEKEDRSATAIAETDVEVVAIDGESFSTFVAHNPTDAVAMMKNLSGNLRKTTDKLLDATKTVATLIDTGDENLQKTSVWGKLKTIASYYKSFSNDKGAASKTNYAAGEVIFVKGQAANVMYKLVSGEIDLYGTMMPQGEPFATLSAGAILGEMGVLEEQRRSATASAKTDVEIRPINATELVSYFETMPEDALKVLKSLSAALRDTNAAYFSALETINYFVKNHADAFANIGVRDYLLAYSDEYNHIMSTYAMTPHNMYMGSDRQFFII